MSQLKNALQPAINDVKVEWLGVSNEDSLLTMPEVQAEKTLLGYQKPKVTPQVSTTGQAPFKIPPIYDGTRLLAYRLFADKEVPTGTYMARYYCYEIFSTIFFGLALVGSNQGFLL